MSRVAAASAGAATPAGADGGSATAPPAPARDRDRAEGGAAARTGRADRDLGGERRHLLGQLGQLGLELLDPLPGLVGPGPQRGVSRAWEKNRSTRRARPISAAKPTSAPTVEMKW